MSIEVKRINTAKSILGEGPYWDDETQSLLLADILGKSVQRYIPATDSYVKTVVGNKTVAFIIPIEGAVNTYVISYGNEIAKLTWDGVSDTIQGLETIAAHEKKQQFNDSKADPSGRLWTGTFVPYDRWKFASKEGYFFALTEHKTLKVLLTDITISNGLVWNESIKKFYYVDSVPREVYSFDYDGNDISNRQIIFKLDDLGLEGLPDGMTLDTDGNLWVAIFNGSKVIKIDPRTPNTLLQTVDIPVRQVTSVEFGGENLEDLYVTTGAVDEGDGTYPDGGWVYKVTGLGVRGVPARRVKL